MKIPLAINNGAVQVGSRTASLLSGTFHYWRVHPQSWPQVLDSIREMGVETVETYVPWQFHELSPGQYDFEGRTDSRRDLAGFLRLTQEKGFWLIIRPGPYIYSEWVNMGVPDDVLAYHRLHPYFKQRAETWLTAVTQQLLPYLATNGGPIIMLQPDNEADTFEQAYRRQLGLGDLPGPFQEFLHQRYHGQIEQLNAAWGAHYACFEDARALMKESSLLEEHRRRYIDFVAFRADYIAEVLRYYGDVYRRLGVDVPLYANAYDITNVQDFRLLEETSGLVGLDSYPPREFTGRLSPKGDDYKHRRLNEVWRSLRTFSKCAYLAEYQAGIAHGLHYWAGLMTPNHMVYAGLTAIQAGIQAWNWFMLVNHDNFMMCPINEWGRKQGELFEAFRELASLYWAASVPRLERVTDLSVVYSPTHQLFADALDDPLLTALYAAGIDYEFYNLDTGRLHKPFLLYAGPRWMEPQEQQKLAEYVDAGGTLIFFETLPLYAADNRTPCNRLGLTVPNGGMDVPFLDHLASELAVDLGGLPVLARLPFQYFTDPAPGTPLWASCTDTTRIWDTAFEENRRIRSLVFTERYQVGYVEARGRGRLVVLSLKPTPALLQAVLEFLGCAQPVRVQVPEVKHALFRSPAGLTLVLINTSDHPVTTRVNLALDRLPATLSSWKNLRNETAFPVTPCTGYPAAFYVRLDGKGGTILISQNDRSME